MEKVRRCQKVPAWYNPKPDHRGIDVMSGEYALSLKQPWATLLVHGRKTIEVRRWPTARRGRILIHAARVPDSRPEGWALLPPELSDAAQQMGGIVGAGDLSDCIEYRSVESFSADAAHHLNAASWFSAPVLYGFRFTNLAPVPFRPCSGWMRFFPVDDAEQAVTPSPPHPFTPSLLVSVRSADEAEVALAGGAALIDVKEPSRGSLGRADADTIRSVIERVAGRASVSAALGELLDTPSPVAADSLGYVKWGLSNCGRRPGWRRELQMVGELQRGKVPSCALVAVAYADWERARAPAPEEVVEFARTQRCGAFLLDTWQKDGTTLLDWVSAADVARWVRAVREADVRVALAGSLGPQEMMALREAAPDWFAVRRAVCKDGQRDAPLVAEAVERLADFVAGFVTATNHED
jgi:uncharacterized protein (UPF0264 family)